jgi:hypothetical protein
MFQTVHETEPLNFMWSFTGLRDSERTWWPSKMMPARTGHTATAWNLETITKVCELVTTDRCMSLKLTENQVQVDFESDVLNYSLGPITWNFEGIKGTWIVWDTFLHALYIQIQTHTANVHLPPLCPVFSPCKFQSSVPGCTYGQFSQKFTADAICV